jgi:hypothetical protein
MSGIPRLKRYYCWLQHYCTDSLSACQVIKGREQRYWIQQERGTPGARRVVPKPRFWLASENYTAQKQQRCSLLAYFATPHRRMSS